jgi:hypothetical protein
MNRNKIVDRRQRFIEWTLPVEIVERELEKYNNRKPSHGNPSGGTFPTYRAGVTGKKRRIDNLEMLIKIVTKFKRRERWEIFKAEHHEYIERIHFRSQNIPQAVESFGLNGNGEPEKVLALAI